MHPTTIVRRAAAALLVLAAPLAARAQWKTTYETFYLQAPHNWYFRNQYQGADRLFNAFDYGHAILYETLWTKPDAPAALLERRQYDYLIINRDVKEAVDQLATIIQAERCRTSRLTLRFPDMEVPA